LKSWAVHVCRGYLAEADRSWAHDGIAELVSLYIDFGVHVRNAASLIDEIN
jgi:hypothetical protein